MKVNYSARIASKQMLNDLIDSNLRSTEVLTSAIEEFCTFYPEAQNALDILLSICSYTEGGNENASQLPQNFSIESFANINGSFFTEKFAKINQKIFMN